MSIGIQDLSDEHVVRITKVLARRPEYGIAIPSRRWLQRQEEKIRDLPKELLRSNFFKRLATKIADSIDPNIVDPRAILCETHSNLNPFLIRRLFIALAYEVTVHTDVLRSWPGRTLAPELAAFVGRLDSIAALWIEPELFHEIYGLAPFDSHHVFVKSSCEACCLAAVGASGRALADLRAALIDRMERRRAMPAGQEPRLYRVVEVWIDHLRKHREGGGRSEECRAMSNALLDELRMARPQIEAWRAEQKQRHSKLRAPERSVHTELKRTKTGAQIAPLPANADHKRRTRNGIPVALADVESAAQQRRSAMYMNRADSIYRPDSLSGYSEVHERQRAVGDLPPGPRPPARENRISNASHPRSFLKQLEQSVSINDEPGFYDFEEEQKDDERDYEEEERSRVKVQEWWASILCESQLGHSQDGARSVVSMVHPAFRPGGSSIAESALPKPLHIEKDRGAPTRTFGDRGTAVSEWTDCTVYTVGQSTIQPGTETILPVPRAHSTYKHRESSPGVSNKPPGTSSHSLASVTRTSSIVRNKENSTISSCQYGDRSTSKTNPSNTTSASKEGKHSPLDWPAPPHGPPTAQDKRNPTRHTETRPHPLPRPSSSVYDRHSIALSSQASSPVPAHDTYSITSMSSAAFGPIESHEAFPDKLVPRPATVEKTRDHAAASSITQLEGFRGRM